MYISVEGLDGSGKTTLIDFLRKKLSNCAVVKLAKPRNIQESYDNEKLIARQIKLRSETFIIQDRGPLTTAAYNNTIAFDQKTTFKNTMEHIDNLAILPDLIIYLDIPINVSLLRKKDFYDRQMLIKIKKNYNQFIEIFKALTEVKIIDGTMSKKKVQRQAEEIIYTLLTEDSNA